MIYCKYCRNKKGCVYAGEDCTREECKDHIPTTNADRIRAMSDEELADEILRWFNWLNAVDWQNDRIINWLKEEVKE